MVMDTAPVDSSLVPGFFAASRVTQAPQITGLDKPPIVVGQKTSGGTIVAGTPTRVLSPAHGWQLGGAGSVLGAMCAAYFVDDPNGELWAVGIADNGSGTAATGSLAFSGTATQSGTIRAWIGGRLVLIPVTSGDGASDVAAECEDVIGEAVNLPVTGSTTTSTCTLTSRHKGTVGNQVDVYVDPLSVPAGITVTVTTLASGATDPTSTGEAGLGAAQGFDAVALSLAGQISTWLALIVARWQPESLIFGTIFAGAVDSVASLISAAEALDDGRLRLCSQTGLYSPAYELAAATMGAAMRRFRATGGSANLAGLEVRGVTAHAEASENTYTSAKLLLEAGAMTYTRSPAGILKIQRDRSTYKLDSAGVADSTFRDGKVAHQVMSVIRAIKATVDGCMYLANLVPDGQSVGGAGPVKIQTPASVRAAVNATVRRLVALGIMRDAAGFDADSTYAINPEDAEELVITLPPKLVKSYLRTAATFNIGG